ncbi:toll/interleukin-1 receptor domain-containing protein [Bacillus pumilus]|uniref:toll/interleukin-1 receptor domain-containing protein n=1 Tax=Bacillus pumilus TaxID=1408 RepID=UPI0024C15878|nr:toll/interleukin-1 receptor domain-containing protein [Bacillus pumilus]WHX46117.1 toll/interleukin-1 receptor domain-containing protein [Bacillus pumilus]
MPEIFISHSNKDFETIVSPFLDMLIMGLDIKRDEIYCTSDRDIPTGENFPVHIKTNIVSASLVVMILTENYINSHFCLNEMGAAWANNTSIYPIVIPPSTFNILQHSALRGGTNVLVVSNEDALQQLRDEFSKKELVGKVRSVEFGSRARAFLESINNEKKRLEKEGSDYVDPLLFKNLESELRDTRIAYDEKNKLLEAKNKIIEELKKAKNPSEVKEIIHADMPMWDKLLEQVEEIKEVILNHRLDWKSISLLFNEVAIGRPFVPRDSMMWSSIIDLEATRFVEVDEGRVYLNMTNKSVKDVLKEIKNFQLLTEECSHEIFKRFEEEFGVEIDINNKLFWEKALNQKGIELSQ